MILGTIQCPLGTLFAAVDDSGVRVLEFVKTDGPIRQLELMRRTLGAPLERGEHPLLGGLREQLDGYFDGGRRVFDLPLNPKGTPFQERVCAYASNAISPPMAVQPRWTTTGG